MPLTWLSPMGGEGDTSCRHPFPGRPGLSPVVLSATFFRTLRFDCSIKEQNEECGCGVKYEAFVLNKFFTSKGGE